MRSLARDVLVKMLPVGKILADFMKAAMEPPWRAAFNSAVSTKGRDAQESDFASLAFLGIQVALHSAMLNANADVRRRCIDEAGVIRGYAGLLCRSLR